MDLKEQLFNHWGQRLGLVEFVEREGLCMLHKLFEGAPHTWVLEEGNQPLSMLHLLFPSPDCWHLDTLWKVSIIQPCDSMEPLVWLLVWLAGWALCQIPQPNECCPLLGGQKLGSDAEAVAPVAPDG